MAEKNSNSSLDNLPFVTLIMPVRNESDFIESSVGAILVQNYPHDKTEIIIADGKSNDGTIDNVNNIICQNKNFFIKLIENQRKIFSTGFNEGLKIANGDIIIMLGGHTEINPDYIKQCVYYLSTNNVDCVGGTIETVGDTEISRSIATAMSSPFGVGGVTFRMKHESKIREVDTVAFGAYKMDSIKKCGLIDEEMVKNQDDEYNYRLRKLGGKILLAPDIKSKYYSRSSIRKLWSQYFQYGYWKVRVLQKHPRQMRLRQFVPLIFMASLITTFIFALFTGWGKTLFGMVAGSYILANILASVITASKNGLRHVLLLPVVFATLHLSYGSGFLVGLVRFANRWKDKGIHHGDTEFAEK